jgi:hypothetical protein
MERGQARFGKQWETEIVKANGGREGGGGSFKMGMEDLI